MITREEAIILDVISTLQTITIANGYRTDVATVEPIVREWEDAKLNSVLPAIGVGWVITPSYEYTPTDRLEVPMGIVLTVNVDAEPGLGRLSKLCDLLDDIIGALHVDVTRGSEAIDTKLIKAVSDQPDPYSGARPTGSMLLDFTIRYERTTGQSP